MTGFCPTVRIAGDEGILSGFFRRKKTAKNLARRLSRAIQGD
jgi:hypothetical protein